MPMMTNSVVPMANAASASAMMGRGSLDDFMSMIPGSWSVSLGDDAELLQQRQVVFEMPVLGDAAVVNAVDVGGNEIDCAAVTLLCRRAAAEDAGKVATEAQPPDHPVPAHRHLFDFPR